MHMLPQAVYNFQSSAEKKIFTSLEKVDFPGAIALHSLNLPEHQYKQWAEADFVIVSSKGVLVLEVKGGGVRCVKGLWSVIDRFGAEHNKSESPFDQARTARFSVEKRLNDLLPQELVKKINFGFGVVFPDVVFDGRSVEWDSELVFDAISHEKRQLSIWLVKLYRYWLGKTKKDLRLSDEEVSSIVKSMRPDLDQVPALISRVGSTFEKLVRLTEEQYRYLDGLLMQPRVIIDGGAGTGKTFLAIEATRRLAALGKHVLYVCRSPVLVSHVQWMITGDQVEVINYQGLMERLNEKKNIEFNVLVVDEGQDFLDVESLNALDSLFEGGLDKGNWLFFMDSNNQGSIYDKPDADILNYLKESSLVWPLYDNCRNTRQIAAATMLLTGGDIGRSRVKGDGLKVDFVYYGTDEEAIEHIEKLLTKWVDEEQITPGDITILSMREWGSSIAKLLNKRWRRRLHKVDVNSGAQWHSNSLTFSSVIDFKGLENKYILLIDFERFEVNKPDISKLYVGMTRGNAVVNVILPYDVKSMLDSLQCDNLSALQEYLIDED